MPGGARPGCSHTTIGRKVTMRKIKAIVAAAFSVALLASAMAGPPLARAENGNLRIQGRPFEFDPNHSGIGAAGGPKHLRPPDPKGNQNLGLVHSQNGQTPPKARAGPLGLD